MTGDPAVQISFLFFDTFSGPRFLLLVGDKKTAVFGRAGSNERPGRVGTTSGNSYRGTRAKIQAQARQRLGQVEDQALRRLMEQVRNQGYKQRADNGG